MSETENVDYEENLPADEYDSESIDSTNFRAYFINRVLSFVRQFLCFGGVATFPIFSQLQNKLRLDIDTGCVVIVDVDSDKKYTTYPEVNALEHSLAYHKNVMIVSAIAILSSVLLLHWLGRKLTVVMANLLQLLVLLHTYIMVSLQELQLLPYSISLAHEFVRDISNVTYYIYLAEISSTIYRAFFLGLYVFTTVAADRAIVNMKEKSSKITPIITQTYRNCAIATTFSLVMALLLPDTPFSTILKGNPEKAEKTLGWLRAGEPDTLEFDQMITKAESIKVNGILQRSVSRTFILGLIFSLFFMLSNFNTCDMLEPFMDDFFYPESIEGFIKAEYLEINKTLQARPLDKPINFYVVALFLVYSSVIPRKLIFLVSYLSSILIITLISFQRLSLNQSIQMASHCDIPHTLGLTELVKILPVEIYPATLREVGVAISIFLNRLEVYFFLRYQTDPQRYYEHYYINFKWTYACFFGSFIGVPFILLFMPETRKINMFELDKLDLHLPFTQREETLEEEDKDIEGEI